jgi:hypothetical protein
MRQHQEPLCLRRAQQQRRHFASALYTESERFEHCHFAVILAEHPT